MQKSERKNKKTYPIRTSMAVNFIGVIILLLVIFGVIVSAIGIASFTRAFKLEYSTTTYHMADTAATLVNGDHLSAYLEGRETAEYQRIKRSLDSFCRRMNVSIIYVIQVDRSDYGSFVSIFNSLDNDVDDTAYVEWELGHQRITTNEEYRQKYMKLYRKESLYETIYRTNPNDGSHPHITTMVPVKNSLGNVTGILCIQRPISELQDAIRPYVRRVVISGILLAALASVFIAIYIRKQFVEPVRLVSEEASRFAKENTKGEALGAISRFKVISNLAFSIDTMEHDMVSYMENLTAITAEKERIGAELELASTIQENSIPTVFPAFPDRTEFDIYASMTPAKEVGGDFYNFFLVDDDHLALFIGDVSGKGIPAALFMMVTNILLTDRVHSGDAPSEILSYVNRTLCVNNEAEMFVTIWLGILEISTGILTASNAGHEYPVIRRKNGRFEQFKDNHSFVVGAIEDISYNNYEITLESGDELFVYTDGVTEASDPDYSMFGAERMLDALNEAPDFSAETMLRSVREAVDIFTKGAEKSDDLTMLALEYRGKPSEEPVKS